MPEAHITDESSPIDEFFDAPEDLPLHNQDDVTLRKSSEASTGDYGNTNGRGKPPSGLSQSRGSRFPKDFIPLNKRNESVINEDTRKIIMMLENDKACKVPRPNLGLQDRLKSLMQQSVGKRTIETDISKLKTDNLVKRHRGAHFQYSIPAVLKKRKRLKSSSESQDDSRVQTESYKEGTESVQNNAGTSPSEVQSIDHGLPLDDLADINETTRVQKGRYGSIDYQTLLQAKSRCNSVIKRRHSCHSDGTNSTSEIDKLKFSQDHGADPNTLCGNTPALLRAVRDGSLYIVQALEAAGADTDARLATGDSALHIAARNGHSEIIVHLVQSGAHVDAINRNDVTPLQMALAHGWLEPHCFPEVETLI
ncbi:hypothetical protein SK128_018011 [Halocaridina rubra]|uniref:Uncharacterized protein n=1 Tax=Halocaridina rubra TaxID=373956 RepID=A0AAN8ZPD4_HALRR